MANESSAYNVLSQRLLASASAMQKVLEEREKSKTAQNDGKDSDDHIFPVVCM